MNLTAKVNVFPIITAHIDTFVDASTVSEKLYKPHLFMFYGTSLILAMLSFFVIPGGDFISVVITSLSVFAALLFNLLMLVLSVIEKKKGNRTFILLQRETYANISYAILMALVTTALLIVPYFYPLTHKENEPVTIAQIAFWGVVYFLLVNFGLTMAMILKRMHTILVKLIEIDAESAT